LYNITEILAHQEEEEQQQQEEKFEDGNVIKKCLAAAGNLSFNSFKNKMELCSAHKEIQLLQSTVTEELNVYPIH
jgi:galactose-1-phosphate uridylyltransferase